MIRSAPLYGYSRKGSIEIFAGQGRDQYLAEGVIVALWTLGCGLAAGLLLISTKIRFPLLRHALALLSLSIFAVLSVHIFDSYSMKTRWYNVKDTVPAPLWTWLSASTKKSSGLFKRLLRVSEVFLYEFKDWDSFQIKAKSLVWDYAVKELESLRATYLGNGTRVEL